MIYLASRSPRRQELLRQIGVDFEPLAVDVDETRRPGEPAADFVARAAADKAAAAVESLHAREAIGYPVLAADTAVVLNDVVMGKPRDFAHARAMLEHLSDRTHEVMTGVCVQAEGGVHTAVSTTRVRFTELSAAAIRRYWKSGEPQDKAGAYAIQGRGAVFVAHIEGSYSNVVGLPLFETARLLAEAGEEVL